MVVAQMALLGYAISPQSGGSYSINRSAFGFPVQRLAPRRH
jgi:hypothetical protein